MKFASRLALSLALAGGLLWILARMGNVGPADVWAALMRLPAGTWALALAIHAGIYLARAMRFRVLLPADERPGLPAVLACSSAHNLASYVLPAKTGEASLVVYLRGAAGISASAGLASLLLSRLFDLAVLFMGVGLSSAVLADALADGYGSIVRGIGLALAAIGGFAAFLCLRPELLMRLGSGVVQRLGSERLPGGARVLRALEKTADAMTRSASGGRVLHALLLSAAVWGLVFLFYAVLARGAGLPQWVGYPQAVFGASLAVLFNLLPINGFAGFGTQEAGWKIGFVMLGVKPELALSTGVAVHLVQLGNVVLFGLLGHFAMAWLGRSALAPEPPEPPAS